MNKIVLGLFLVGVLVLVGIVLVAGEQICDRWGLTAGQSGDERCAQEGRYCTWVNPWTGLRGCWEDAGLLGCGSCVDCCWDYTPPIGGGGTFVLNQLPQDVCGGMVYQLPYAGVTIIGDGVTHNCP